MHLCIFNIPCVLNYLYINRQNQNGSVSFPRLHPLTKFKNLRPTLKTNKKKKQLFNNDYVRFNRVEISLNKSINKTE